MKYTGTGIIRHLTGGAMATRKILTISFGLVARKPYATRLQASYDAAMSAKKKGYEKGLTDVRMQRV